MFAKPASFKPYAAIKNSERKQVLGKIESQCKLDGEDPALRQKLLPKTVQSAKAVTHGNEKITVYAESQLPLWVVPRQGMLVPTVALMLGLPDEFQLRLLPNVYTVGRTLQFLQNGADFMVPGVFGDLPQAKRGDVVAIRDLDTNALLATGVALVDLTNLNPDNDKGKCVQSISVVGDKLTPKTEVRALGPGAAEPAEPAAEAPQEPATEDTTEPAAHEEAPGTAEDAPKPDPTSVSEQMSQMSVSGDVADAADADGDLSPKEVDEAFMYAVNKVIREPRTYPLTMAGFAALLGENMPYEHSQLNIRNSTFKKMNKLIKHAEKMGLLTSRERQGGEVLVTGVNVPVGEAASAVSLPSRGTTKKQQERMSVEIGYKPHPNVRLVAPNLPTTELVDASTLKKMAFGYILGNGLAKPGDKEVQLDVNLRKALALKQTATVVARDDVANLLLRNSTPFHKIVPLGADPSQAKWQKGGVPSIQIRTERRGGNKTVTLVGTQGLQGFHIDPNEFADVLRHACAGSAALTDSKGFAAITVQGNHVAKITQVLERQGVRPAWIKS